MTKKYKIKFNKRFLKDLQKIPKKYQNQIREVVQSLITLENAVENGLEAQSFALLQLKAPESFTVWECPPPL